jgi:plasmid stabilization system protein ParE
VEILREVILAPEAEAGLHAILDYIAADNPMAAGAMSAKFDELFRGIAIAPNAGTKSRRDKRLRRRVLGNYIVHYVFDEPNDRVLILAIIHGARVRHRMRGRD